MCIFCIFVDKGIQSLRDDGAGVGERMKVHLALIKQRDTLCLEKHNDKNPLTLWFLLVWDQSFLQHLQMPFSLFWRSSWHLHSREELLQRWRRYMALKF